MSSLLSVRPPEPAANIALVALAAAAGATAAWVEAQSRQAERDNPPAGRFIHLDGVRLHYTVTGEGPPVVLVHGNAVTQADFAASRLVQRLAREHQVITFDRPGFGYSSRPRDRLWTPSAQAALLHRALQALGIHQPVVLGHSFGAMVAMAMALEFPSSLAGVVLVSGYYFPTVRWDALAMVPVAVPLLGDVMRYTVTALSARLLLGRLVKGMFAPNQVPADYLPTLSRAMLLRPMQLRAGAEDAAFMMPAARSLASRYPQLKLPVTVVAGADDKVVDPDAHARRLHAQLPHSRLVIVPGAGHMAHHVGGEEIARALA